MFAKQNKVRELKMLNPKPPANTRKMSHGELQLYNAKKSGDMKKVRRIEANQKRNTLSAFVKGMPIQIGDHVFQVKQVVSKDLDLVLHWVAMAPPPDPTPEAPKQEAAPPVVDLPMGTDMGKTTDAVAIVEKANAQDPANLDRIISSETEGQADR